MALSQEVMFKDKALEKLIACDLKFPKFPWINFENELKDQMRYSLVYNLASCREFVRDRKEIWEACPQRASLFDYDYNRYGMDYYDELGVVNLWSVLESYAQLYFIYVIKSSYIVSNYSIRVDSVLSDNGNFPLWHTDFFQSDRRRLEAYSRHSHILDYDSIRLGQKVIKDNIHADSFDFGVVVMTEIGKERGNSLDLQELKKREETTNQKNDLFNAWLKLVRHSATVDFFPFVRVITDEQRPESWGADARQLCDIVHIRDGGETALAMPFFTVGELLHDWLLTKFSNLYNRYRFARADNTLPMYLLKAAVARFQAYYQRIYNLFGYCAADVEIERGTQDGELDSNKYYLCNKKIYSHRFSTDCFSSFFEEKNLRSPVGIDDLPEYSAETASFDEMLSSNSYFFNELSKLRNLLVEEKETEVVKVDSKCKNI